MSPKYENSSSIFLLSKTLKVLIGKKNFLLYNQIHKKNKVHSGSRIQFSKICKKIVVFGRGAHAGGWGGHPPRGFAHDIRYSFEYSKDSESAVVFLYKHVESINGQSVKMYAHNTTFFAVGWLP